VGLETRTHPPIMREGWPFAGGPLAASVLLAAAGWAGAAAAAALLGAFCLWFFRNPRRALPDEPGAVVSAGDGRVLAVEEVDDPRWPGDRAWKISVFLNASFDKASEANERTEICIEDDRGRRVVFRQIAGLVARRIVCYLRPGDVVSRGQIMGLIRFGSRVELVLPAGARVAVAPGDRVKGGSTVMAWMP
jgi:phosphatidylserine decarboxylase